jgi:hypothetical protein
MYFWIAFLLDLFRTHNFFLKLLNSYRLTGVVVNAEFYDHFRQNPRRQQPRRYDLRQ